MTDTQPTQAQAQSSIVFPVASVPSGSSSSSGTTSKSRLTSSDKLTELPNANASATGDRPSRSFRRSLDSLPTPAAANDSIGQVWGASLRQTASLEGNETPKQRVSFEGERSSKLARAGRDGSERNASAIVSPVRSRASSPLRIFQQISAGFHRRAPEEPFIPINPFAFKFRWRFPRWHHPAPPPPLPLNRPTSPAAPVPVVKTRAFFTDTLPRQIYLHLLLRMPALYFSRVARIFQDAEVSRPDIQRMLDAAYASAPANKGAAMETGTGRDYELDEILLSNNAPSNRTSVVEARLGDDTGLTPALVRFKHSWEDFVTSLIKEWKTLNVVSALLLSAILTLLQIAPALASPTTRTLSLLSLVCALMSLCYGCVYIVRFATMRSMARAARFAEEARKTYTAIWWNVWTLLAMPAVWLAWAVVWFVAAVLAFVWGTASLDGEEDGDAGGGGGTGKLALVERVVITTVLGVGLVYFALIVVSLARYTGAPSKRPLKEDASASSGRVPVPMGRDAQSAAELGLGMGLRSGSPDLALVVDGTERGRRAAKAGWGAAAGPGTGSGSLRAVAVRGAGEPASRPPL